MRVFLGGIIWLLVLVAVVAGLSSYAAHQEIAASKLQTFLTDPRTEFEMNFDRDDIVKVGDPIVHYDGEQPRIVGAVIRVDSMDSTENRLVYAKTVYGELFSSAPDIQTGDFVTYHRTPDSMDWVVQMMLPESTREEISQLIITAFNRHQSEIVDVMQPIVVKSIRDAADVIREDFAVALKNRNQQIQALQERYQKELVEGELVPLVQEEVLPIIQTQAEPLARKIGQRIWREASLFRFGWRYLYDQSPLPRKDLLEKEFERFLQREAIPIIKSHVPEIVDVQQQILLEISDNRKVKAVVSDATNKIANDPEFQKLVADLLKDVFVDNERLKETIAANWQSPEAVEALAITNKKLDPTITAIGATLFGSPDTRITPEFARVLRNKILHKDDRWFVIHTIGKRTGKISDKMVSLPIRVGKVGTENPFNHVDIGNEVGLKN